MLIYSFTKNLEISVNKMPATNIRYVADIPLKFIIERVSRNLYCKLFCFWKVKFFTIYNNWMCINVCNI